MGKDFTHPVNDDILTTYRSMARFAHPGPTFDDEPYAINPAISFDLSNSLCKVFFPKNQDM